MVETNTKLAGTSRLLRGTFYSGGENTKATLTTSITANSNVTLISKEAGIIGNDISLTYIDSGLEVTPLELTVKNGKDIEVVLERSHSYASYSTTNPEVDANLTFTAAAAGTAGNAINITLIPTAAASITSSTIGISGKVVTITATHSFAIGDVIGVSGIVYPKECNGCWQITAVSGTTTFSYAILDDKSATVGTGVATISKMSISVGTGGTANDITISSPLDYAGNPMATPESICKLWGRTAAAKALANCRFTGDTGDERIGLIQQRYLTNGKASAISTTGLDIKREIETHAIAKDLVDVLIPENTTGAVAVIAMAKTFLTGGSNLTKVDPDDQEVTVTVYDNWENVLTTVEPENVTRKSLGVYECVYAPHKKYRVIVAEFSCYINEELVMSRQKIDLDWTISDTEA